LCSQARTDGKHKPPKKKRFPSTEEKLIEIDTFLSEEDPAQLIASPSMTTPVSRIFGSNVEYFPRTNTRAVPSRRVTGRPRAKEQKWAMRIELAEAPPRPRRRLRPAQPGVRLPPVMTAKDEEYNFF
jgi:hypothetical protein